MTRHIYFYGHFDAGEEVNVLSKTPFLYANLFRERAC